MLNYSSLADEINKDPVGMGYVDHLKNGNDQAISDLLNAQTRESTRRVPLWEVKRHALLQGYWIAIKVAAATHGDVQVRGAAISAIDYVDDLRFEAIDLSNDFVQAMLSALVDGKVITAEQKTDLETLSGTTVSRADELFGRTVTVNDVSLALRGV